MQTIDLQEPSWLYNVEDHHVGFYFMTVANTLRSQPLLLGGGRGGGGGLQRQGSLLLTGELQMSG